MRPSLITTPPTTSPCARCGRWTLVGTSEGLRVRVDVAALTVAQQIQATLARIQTYWVTRTGLVHNDHYRASNAKGHPVAPEHRCDLTWEQPALPARPTPPTDDKPPY